MVLPLLFALLAAPAGADPQPAPPAQAGSLQDVVVKGAEKDEPSAEKPPFDVQVDAYESIRPTLKPDEALLLAESPALATWDRTRPDRLREPLLEPWNDALFELSKVEFSPASLFGPDAGRSRGASWSLSLVDEDGKPFKTFTGAGSVPQSLSWDGRSEQGSWMLAGHAYSAVYKIAESSSSARTVMGRQLQYAGLVHRDNGVSVIGLDSSALFGTDRAQKDVSAAGKKLLRAAADWIKRRDYGRMLTVQAFAGDAELARAQAAAVRSWLCAQLSVPESRVAVSGASSAASEQRVDLVVDER